MSSQLVDTVENGPTAHTRLSSGYNSQVTSFFVRLKGILTSEHTREGTFVYQKPIHTTEGALLY